MSGEVCVSVLCWVTMIYCVYMLRRSVGAGADGCEWHWRSI